MIQPHFKTLQRMADDLGVSLMAAFQKAGVPSSTFYRAKQGQDLRTATAKQVERAILTLWQTAQTPDAAAA